MAMNIWVQHGQRKYMHNQKSDNRTAFPFRFSLWSAFELQVGNNVKEEGRRETEYGDSMSLHSNSVHRKAYMLSKRADQELNDYECYTNGTHQPHCTSTYVNHSDRCQFVVNKCHKLSRYTSYLITIANTFNKQNQTNIQMPTKGDPHYDLPQSDTTQFTRSVPAHQCKLDNSTFREFIYHQVEGNRYLQNTSLSPPSYVESLSPRQQP
jgi:hypothetical protein